MIDYKEKQVPLTTISRDMVSLSADTGNVYETVMTIAKRANQIGQDLKAELHGRLEEFNTIEDDLKEVYESSEQTEVSREYELMPKPTLIAAREYELGELYHNVAGRRKD